MSAEPTFEQKRMIFREMRAYRRAQRAIAACLEGPCPSPMNCTGLGYCRAGTRPAGNFARGVQPDPWVAALMEAVAEATDQFSDDELDPTPKQETMAL